MTAKSTSAGNRQYRPVFQPASEELRAISAALVDEVRGWPGVTTRAMFGGTMLYRARLPFALLPQTKKMMEPDGLWLKFHTVSASLGRKLAAESRIVESAHQTTKDNKEPKWVGLVVSGPSDVHHALRWLGEAHEAARKQRTAR